MIPVEEAQNKILSFIKVLEPEKKAILDCLGQVLAENVFSAIDVPPLDNSAMDGFAVRAEDTYGANSNTPIILPVIDQVAAGYIASKKVTPQTAIRIMTGAVVPDGADAIVQFEDTDEVARKNTGADQATIGIIRQADKGQHIRQKGEDISKGAIILPKGTMLHAAQIGVLASLGYSDISVIRRPKVAVLVTGDELLDIGQPLSPGKIYNSNAYSLAAQIMWYGGIPKILGIGRDSFEAINQKIDSAEGCDMLITSGGVSLGDYDVVKDVLANRGKIELWTVCMKPGKPSAFGTIKVGDKKILHLGLPGNPVSSMVTFEQFARPAMFKMMGRNDIEKATIQAVMDDDVKNSDGRRIYLRVIVSKKDDTYHARITGPQGSGVLTSMAKANGLAIVPENTSGVKAGDIVKVQILD
jgi:molybdopterin molybdotransferase